MESKDCNLEELITKYEKKIYDLKQLLDIFRSFCSTLEQSKLLESIIFSCMAQMRVVNAGIFVLDTFSCNIFYLETTQTLSVPNCKIKYQIPFGDEVVKILLEEKQPITLDSLIKKTSGKSEIIEMLKTLEPSLIIPLIQKNNINGILFLGERFTFDDEMSVSYTDYEKEQILTIASLAAISINNAALVERASTDMTTQVKLKSFFYNVLTEKLEDAVRTKKPLAVLMFDIDFFKKFNDTYGHECGDYVLKNVASLIKSNIREDDLPSRYGGEEFAVLLNDVKRETAISIAEKIRTSIAEHDFIYQDKHMNVTISGGVAVFDYKINPVRLPRQLVNQADKGLYMSKHNGRNRITYAHPSLVADNEVY